MLRIISDGINYAFGLTLLGLALSYFLNPWLGMPLYLVALFCLWFFRDPNRKIPPGDVLVSPADGKIVAIGPMRNLLQSEHPWVRAYFHGKRSQMLQPKAS